MFVNGIAFLVTISQHIKFWTAEILKNQKVSTLIVAIKDVLDTFKIKGITVHTVIGDGHLASLKMVWLMLGWFWMWLQEINMSWTLRDIS